MKATDLPACFYKTSVYQVLSGNKTKQLSFSLQEPLYNLCLWQTLYTSYLWQLSFSPHILKHFLFTSNVYLLQILLQFNARYWSLQISFLSCGLDWPAAKCEGLHIPHRTANRCLNLPRLFHITLLSAGVSSLLTWVSYMTLTMF